MRHADGSYGEGLNEVAARFHSYIRRVHRDHAVAEHTIALLMELARQVGKLDRQVKTGDWDGADVLSLYGSPNPTSPAIGLLRSIWNIRANNLI